MLEHYSGYKYCLSVAVDKYHFMKRTTCIFFTVNEWRIVGNTMGGHISLSFPTGLPKICPFVVDTNIDRLQQAKHYISDCPNVLKCTWLAVWIVTCKAWYGILFIIPIYSFLTLMQTVLPETLFRQLFLLNLNIFLAFHDKGKISPSVTFEDVNLPSLSAVAFYYKSKQKRVN